MKNMPSLFLITFFLFVSNLCHGQTTSRVSEFFKTTDRIQAHPAIDNGNIYFGSTAGILYAMDIQTKGLLWSFEVQGNFQSTPVIQDSLIYFSNGQAFFALHKLTGEEKWKYNYPLPDKPGNFDPWDYHHGGPVIYKDRILTAIPGGKVNAYDLLTGQLKNICSSIDSAAIRCIPVVQDDILYFGDWNGRVYAYNMLSGNILWTHKTYETQPYPTFGQINTQLVIKDSILIFGSRNPELQAINIHSGKIAWKHLEADGGWISGDPLIVGDTLFIGGSDCHKMFAFNVHTGELYWEFEFLYNSFSQPISADAKHLVFTTGDAYAYMGENYGRGYLFAIDKGDGTISNVTLVGGNAFTSPVIWKNQMFIGNDDHHLYAIDYNAFTSEDTDLKKKGYQSFEFKEMVPNPFQDSVSVHLLVNYDSSIHLSISDFAGNEIRNFYYPKTAAGTLSITWDGKDQQGKDQSAGYYVLEAHAEEYYQNTFLQKK